MKLYVVRHGETEWNVEKRLQGHLDSSLTQNGTRQAKLLAEKLSVIHFDSIYSSPSGRAIHTANVLKGDRSLPILEDKRLLEIHHGNWQGKTTEEIETYDPEQYEIYLKHPHLYQPKDEGESLYDVLERVEEFLSDLEAINQSGNHLIVTHGVVVKILQMMCKQYSMKEIWQPPHIDGTSLTVIEIDNLVRKLLVEGDVSHRIQNKSNLT